jgi:hypothetical protein
MQSPLQLDVSHMTRLLMGIASTGAWSCFDEFNRMDMEVCGCTTHTSRL